MESWKDARSGINALASGPVIRCFKGKHLTLAEDHAFTQQGHTTRAGRVSSVASAHPHVAGFSMYPKHSTILTHCSKSIVAKTSQASLDDKTQTLIANDPALDLETSFHICLGSFYLSEPAPFPSIVPAECESCEHRRKHAIRTELLLPNVRAGSLPSRLTILWSW